MARQRAPTSIVGRFGVRARLASAIRQEDKDQASRDATVVASIVGAVVGIGVGWISAIVLASSLLWPIVIWATIGLIIGGYCGFLLAGYTRREASRLILEGNRIVLDDIGRATARYVHYVRRAGHENERRDVAFDEFLQRFRPGPTESGGQELLRRAFEQYEVARRSSDPKSRHECTYFANCLAILHEHIRLQPYIAKSLPFLIRKCVTQRLMTYSVGEIELSVHDDVPPLDDVDFPQTLAHVELEELQDFLYGPHGWDHGRSSLKNTRASDWTRLHERMGYVVNLFRTRHLESNVVASPYTSEQLSAIANGEAPSRPW